jgi:leucyl aminopeptidase
MIMELLHVANYDKRKAADGLILPFWKGKKQAEAAFKLDLHDLLEPVLQTGDFKGKEGEILPLYLPKQSEKRIILLGLGDKEKASVERLRRAYGSLTKFCLGKKWQSLNLVFPQPLPLSEEEAMRGISEGLFLANYTFDKLKSASTEEQETALLKKVAWIGISKASLEIAKKAIIISQSVYFTRDLVNGNADDITPQYLAQTAKELAKAYPSLKTTVFDKKRIEKEKLNLLLAVNRGSSLDPVFIIVEYKGNPKSKDHTVIVGKGITYDTGGLNLKTAGMETMKCDMGGAAACLGAMRAAAELGLKTNLTAVIPSTENGIDAASFKPGDVYSSYAGKMVEMTNSDAEGRLILADALSYTVRNLKPVRIIDLATLTGAIEIALGAEASGLMSNNDELAQRLIQAGEATFERVWRMPLFEEYKDKLKSDIADLKSWNGRSGSSSVAAIFLQEFVEDTPWAHLDIAGTAYPTEAKKYLPKYGTGVGVRLLIEFLEQL